jgi:hypothetical protein
VSSGHSSKKSLEIYQHLSLESVQKAFQDVVKTISVCDLLIACHRSVPGSGEKLGGRLDRWQANCRSGCDHNQKNGAEGRRWVWNYSVPHL